jgi:dCMP deaminase
VIVKGKRMVGAGYNGSVYGQPHCDDEGHLMVEGHCERTLHGEENAVINTDRNDLRGSDAYIIGTPCLRCARILINAGVKQINYLGQYNNSRGKEHIDVLAKGAGVKLKNFKLDPEDLINKAAARLRDPGGALAKK